MRFFIFTEKGGEIVELFKLFGTIFVNNEEANEALDDTNEKAEGTGGRFEKLGGIATKAGGIIAAGVGIAVGAVGGLMTKTMETTAEINKFSQVTGMSKEGFQEWDSVAKKFGFSMEAAAGDMAALAERAMDASSGVGENAEMFKKLGVSVTDSSGKLKTQEQLFNETIAGLQGMENATERNAIATAMLSTTGEELAPVLNMTAEELQKMKDNANVISDEDLAKSEEFRLKWEGAKSTLSGVVTEIGINLMPVLTKVLDWVVENMPAIQSTMSTVWNVITTVVKVAAGIFKDYLLPILSQLWSFIQTYLVPVFMALFSFIQSKMPLIRSVTEQAFSIITGVIKIVWDILINYLIPALIKLWEWIEPNIPKVKKIIKDAFDAIFDAVDVVVDVFKDVTDAVKKAIDWLTFWDDKKVKKKTIEVEEKRTSKGSIDKNATGTNYFGGGATLVGERGPELVTLPRGSKIDPANATRNKLGNGGNTTINVYSQKAVFDEKELSRTWQRLEVLYG